MRLLELQNLGVDLGGRRILQDVNLTVGAGEFVGLLGPNGVGKTMLMKAALGLVPALGRSNLAERPPNERARLAAWMPQSREITWPVPVQTLIELGRMPYRPRGRRLNREDAARVDSAIQRMGLDGFRQRRATQLSGGEQARVLIARALAQDTPLLMADEPIAGLDPAGQIETMEVFSRLAREGHAVVASLHDLGLAVHHCTRLVLLGEGGLVADGHPEQVLTSENLARVFQITARLEHTAQGPVLQPMRLASAVTPQYGATPS